MPYVGYAPAGLQATAFDGISNYNSLQVTVRKQLSHGVSFQGAYTWSKSLTDLTGGLRQQQQRWQSGAAVWPVVLQPAAALHHQLQLGYSLRQAQRSRRQTALRLEPLRRDNRSERSSHDLRRRRRGHAYGTQGTGTTSGFGRAQLARALPPPTSLSGGIESRLGGYSGGPGYFNPAAFCAAPAIMPDGVTVTTQAACPTCATLFGNSGMGILLGPGQFNFDMSILKTTKITERSTLQFRAEFYNLLNHPQFNQVAPFGNRRYGIATAKQRRRGSGIITTTSVNPRVHSARLEVYFLDS